MPTLVLREARNDHEDSHAIYHLSNAPDVVAVSTRGKTFAWAEHVEWYDRRIKDSLILIAEVDGQFVGYVRWGKVENKEEAEVAIAVAEPYRRKGYALDALTRSEGRCKARFGNVTLVALVLVGNDASAALFEKAGYKLVGWEERMDKQHQRWEKA